MFYCVLQEDLNTIAEAAQELFDRSDATAFQTPYWLGTLDRFARKHTGKEPLYLAIYEEQSDKLVFLLPLLKKKLGPIAILEYMPMSISLITLVH